MPTSTPQTDTADAPDPLSKLHKMSTTAGVASQQYVAVNTAAVIAALLGVASALTIFSTLLLIIPLAGIIISIVAWRQITDSNGTETGKPVVALGLFLSLLIGGGVAGKELLDASRSRADARKMDAIVQQLGETIKQGDWPAAYKLFDINFHARVPEPEFAARMHTLQTADGKLRSMTWNQVPPQYETIGGGDVHVAVLSAAVKFDAGEGRFTFIFRKVDDGWQIMNLNEVFPVERLKNPQ